MTGTIAVIGYVTGSYFTTIEEIEPLGQKLDLVDPSSHEFPEFPAAEYSDDVCAETNDEENQG